MYRALLKTPCETSDRARDALDKALRSQDRQTIINQAAVVDPKKVAAEQAATAVGLQDRFRRGFLRQQWMNHALTNHGTCASG